MSRAAFTIRAFDIYLIALGIALVLAPNVLRGLFFMFMPETIEVWIRIVGPLILNIGIYVIYAATCEVTEVFRASVLTRTLVLVGFARCVLAGIEHPVLVAVSLVDSLGIICTWRAPKSAT